jgi:VWFA-related protein
MRFRPAFLAALVSLPLFAATTETPIPRSAETIDVSIVNLDVVVTDRNGQRVHGLTKNDFEIFEDRRPQAISNFAAYAPSDPANRQRRTIALFVQEGSVRPSMADSIFASLKKTLRDVIAPGDTVLIASSNDRTSVRLEATDDLRAIDRTLDEIAADCKAPRRFAYVPAPFAELEPTPLQRLAGYGQGLNWTRNGPFAFMPVTMERSKIRDTVAAINSFINAMANDDGRKAMILVANDLDQGRGPGYFYAIDRERAFGWGSNRYQTNKLIDSIEATANASGVSMYVLDPTLGGGGGTAFISSPDGGGGAPYGTAPDMSYLDVMASLKDLAKTTGGVFALGDRAIRKTLPRMRDDFEDYYSLAYRVASRNDNRMRSVAVRTKNPNYRVRTRQQYVEKNDDGRVRDRVIASLFQSPAPAGITVAATTGSPTRREKHRYILPVSVRIPATSLMTTQEGAASRGAFSVYIATARAIGSMSDITKRTVPFTATDVAKAKDGYFTYDFDLLTDAATNRLSVGIYDEVSHDSGFARVDLGSSD